MITDTPRSRCARTVALFALTGFLSGMIGPMVLSPESNLGPIIGVLFSGPAGLLLGVVACILARLAPRLLTRATQYGLAAVLAGVTLYFSLPEPKAIGRLLDGTVSDCRPAAELYPDALKTWERALAENPRAQPLPDWRERALHNVRAFDQEVAILQVVRNRIVFERRRPWDRGERFGGPWYAGSLEKRNYIFPAGGSSCSEWRRQGRTVFSPTRRLLIEPIQPASIWPPVDAVGFLQLQELGPAPTDLQALTD